MNALSAYLYIFLSHTFYFRFTNYFGKGRFPMSGILGGEAKEPMRLTGLDCTLLSFPRLSAVFMLEHLVPLHKLHFGRTHMEIVFFFCRCPFFFVLSHDCWASSIPFTLRSDLDGEVSWWAVCDLQDLLLRALPPTLAEIQGRTGLLLWDSARERGLPLSACWCPSWSLPI